MIRVPFIALALFFVATPAIAADIPVESTITAATVYSDRASITRKAAVKIPAGSHTLVFKGLPISMFTDSLRAGGSAVAKVTLGAVTHKMQSHEDFVIPREQDLNTRLQNLADARAMIMAEKQALDAGRVFLENLGKQAALRADEDIAEIKLAPETWSGVADTLQTKIAANLKTGLERDIAVRGLDDQIRKLQDELNQLRTGQKQNIEVRVPFESAAETTLNVELSYQQPNVGWQPVYDARYDTKSGRLSLVQYGSVWQQTGEDWADVALTLSTAQPSRGVGLPDLYPQWLSLYVPPPMQPMAEMAVMDSAVNMSGASPQMSGRAASFEGEDKMMKAEAVPAAAPVEYATAQINTEGFVGEYNITGPSTVPSDGTQSKLLIGAFETDNAAQIQIKPQFSAEAYLVVKTKLKGEAPILPGLVNLFRDNAFIGQGNLPMLRPGDAQELAFGVDDKVTVKRKTLKDERAESGFAFKEQTLERHVLTEVQNLHKTDIEIAVLETVPTPQDERIRVEILKDVTTPGYEADLHDMKGVTRWRIPLKPEEKTKVTLGWKVSWPKGENLQGL